MTGRSELDAEGRKAAAKNSWTAGGWHVADGKLIGPAGATISLTAINRQAIADILSEPRLRFGILLPAIAESIAAIADSGRSGARHVLDRIWREAASRTVAFGQRVDGTPRPSEYDITALGRALHDTFVDGYEAGLYDRDMVARAIADGPFERPHRGAVRALQEFGVFLLPGRDEMALINTCRVSEDGRSLLMVEAGDRPDQLLETAIRNDPVLSREYGDIRDIGKLISALSMAGDMITPRLPPAVLNSVFTPDQVRMIMPNEARRQPVRPTRPTPPPAARRNGLDPLLDELRQTVKTADGDRILLIGDVVEPLIATIGGRIQITLLASSLQSADKMRMRYSLERRVRIEHCTLAQLRSGGDGGYQRVLASMHGSERHDRASIDAYMAQLAPLLTADGSAHVAVTLPQTVALPATLEQTTLRTLDLDVGEDRKAVLLTMAAPPEPAPEQAAG